MTTKQRLREVLSDALLALEDFLPTESGWEEVQLSKEAAAANERLLEEIRTTLKEAAAGPDRELQVVEAAEKYVFDGTGNNRKALDMAILGLREERRRGSKYVMAGPGRTDCSKPNLSRPLPPKGQR